MLSLWALLENYIHSNFGPLCLRSWHQHPSTRSCLVYTLSLTGWFLPLAQGLSNRTLPYTAFCGSFIKVSMTRNAKAFFIFGCQSAIFLFWCSLKQNLSFWARPQTFVSSFWYRFLFLLSFSLRRASEAILSVFWDAVLYHIKKYMLCTGYHLCEDGFSLLNACVEVSLSFDFNWVLESLSL